jgi:hypothetical protein
MKEVYLGDGLYASFDGFMITLRAPRSNGDHWVGLEPEVYREFKMFGDACMEELRREMEKAREAARRAKEEARQGQEPNTGVPEPEGGA